MAAAAALALASLAAVSSIAGGVQANKEAKKQAVKNEAMANLAAEEEARASSKEALAVGREAESVRRRQVVSFLKSGVDLTGSPLMVMEATRRAGLSNVEETLRSGSLSASTRRIEGRMQADALKASGRQAFVQGIGGALSNAGSAANIYSKM